MKGKFLLSALVLLLPGSLFGQIAKPTTPDTTPEFSRFEIFGGVDYSGANQVRGSAALIGGNVGADAKLKKWFGGTVDFGDYGVQATSLGYEKPTVTTLLAGPELYITSGNITGFVHVLFGGAHTGGQPTGEKPDISFAFAVGGGFNYSVSKHLGVRVSGDNILSSFVLDPTNLGYSPHRRANARAMAGVVYRF